MAENLDYYVNVLSGSSSGLAAVSALKSLDDAAAKATAGIQALERSHTAAVKELETIRAPKALKALESQLAEVSKAKSAAFAKGDMAQHNALAAKKTALENKVSAAREAAATKAAKQEEKIAGISAKIAAAKGDQASNAGLNAAKRALAAKALDEQVAKLGALGDAAQAAGGPVASVVGKLQAIAKAGPAAAAIAVVVALYAVAAAGVVAAVALTRYAVAAADAARSSRLLSSAAAGSGSAGYELERVVDQLATKIPQARAKTAEWARELSLAGFAGRDMQRTLTAMGVTAAAVGDQAAGKIRGIAESSRMAQRFILGARDRFGEFASLSGTGIKAADIYAAVAKSMRVSIPEATRLVNSGIVPFRKGLEALEAAAETRFGPIVARQMLSLSAQGEKLKENLLGLFSGVNIEVFLKGLSSITELFSENNAVGYTLRKTLGDLFSSLSDGSASVFPLLRSAVLGAATAVIKMLTFVKILGLTIGELVGDRLAGIDKAKAAFYAGAGAVVAFTVVAGALALVLGSLAAAALILTVPLWLPFVLGAAAIYAMIKAFDAVGAKVQSTVDAVKAIDMKAAGANIVQGLIDGILSKVGAATDAIKSVATAITGAFDTKMEIESPSKVMTRRANYIIDPLVDVPEQRQGEVRAAIGGLGVSDQPQQGTRGGAGPSSFAPEKIELHFHVVEAGDLPAKVREVIVSLMLGEARGYALAPG